MPYFTIGILLLTAGLFAYLAMCGVLPWLVSFVASPVGWLALWILKLILLPLLVLALIGCLLGVVLGIISGLMQGLELGTIYSWEMVRKRFFGGVVYGVGYGAYLWFFIVISRLVIGVIKVIHDYIFLLILLCITTRAIK